MTPTMMKAPAGTVQYCTVRLERKHVRRFRTVICQMAMDKYGVLHDHTHPNHLNLDHWKQGGKNVPEENFPTGEPSINELFFL